METFLTDEMVQKKPKAMIASLAKAGFRADIDSDMQAKLKQYRKHRLHKLNKSLCIDATMRTRFGGMSEFVNRFRKGIVTARDDFDEHRFYVFGETKVVPAAKKNDKDIFFTISTENLLLNAYRQAVSGWKPYIQIDTTHRLTTEGVACMPIGTMDLAQNFHIIAYGVCLHETTKDHEFALRNIRAEVEAVVHKYAVQKKRV